MKEKIRHFIKELLLEKAYWKQALRDFSNKMTEEEIDNTLDRISEIDELIKKLKRGLK